MAHSDRREARQIKREGILGRIASGNHLSAQNDEDALDVFPELSALNALECARLRADMDRNVDKGERLARANDRAALEAQVLNLDAMRRAGW